MKRKSIIGLLLFCITLGMVNTSCQDMLTPASERHSYVVAQDTLYSYWGILRSLQNIADRYVILGECRGDLVTSTGYVSDTIAAIVNFGQNGTEAKYKDGASKYLKISDYYHVINSCNAYIAECDTFLATGTNQKYMIKEYAQVQAIRAWVYMQLINAYGRVPFYTQPLLTTGDIENFASNNTPYVDASNLADELAPILEKMEFVEKIYGFPQYNDYSGCHSTRCMFPVSLVLGDLYLMQGTEAACAKAAQHYYNFLNDETGGPLLTRSFYTADLTDRTPLPTYNRNGSNPYNQSSKVSKNQESITCIPSTTNKLWGTVLTDVPRLFGFESTISVGTYNTGSSDEDKSTATSASVSLSMQEDPQLVASAGYDTLCMSYPYEVYIGSYSDPDQAVIEELPGVGDARQYWNHRVITHNDLDELDTLYYVMKQNPDGGFSATYPSVYRKTGVWLRYAEAINRAGYPSYAFAVLKNGLCNNDEWYPDPERDYVIKDSLWYAIYNDSIVLPYDIPLSEVSPELFDSLENPITNYAEFEAKVYEMLPDSASFADCQTGYIPFGYGNYTEGYCAAVCHYLDRREVLKSVGVDYMNFNTRYLKGSQTATDFVMKQEVRGNGNRSFSYPTTPIADSYVTNGVHSFGGGRLRYDDRNSSYDYVKLVSQKVFENRGIVLTREDIYSGDYDHDVIEAVEDLIIDECGLEMAFEGNRFGDLARVAHRRGTAYLANRVAMRNGKFNAQLQAFLMNEANWYLPFPVSK